MGNVNFEGKWIQVGDMLVARTNHAAELLFTGEVLIVGGHTSKEVNSPEIYDPVAKRFRQSGKQGACQWGLRTMLLQGGKVLVIGGTTMMLPSKEILVYDPNSEQLEYFGDMYLPREYAVVAPLENSLLIAGGYGGDRDYGERHRCLSRSEIFNLQTLESIEIESMNIARTAHTGTLLQDGRILIVGGISWSSLHSTHVEQATEIFDPQTRKFSLTGNMETRRANHTATLLNDGCVLVIGGEDSSGNALNSAEIYNPMSGVFSTVNAMNTARYCHTATLLPSGHVLIAGGNGGKPSFNALDSVEVYDPYSHVFRQVSRMNVCRKDHTATLLKDGNVLIVGGEGSGKDALCSAEVYSL